MSVSLMQTFKTWQWFTLSEIKKSDILYYSSPESVFFIELPKVLKIHLIVNFLNQPKLLSLQVVFHIHFCNFHK